MNSETESHTAYIQVSTLHETQEWYSAHQITAVVVIESLATSVRGYISFNKYHA